MIEALKDEGTDHVARRWQQMPSLPAAAQPNTNVIL